MLRHWPVRLQYDCHIGRAIKCWVQMLTLAMKRNECTNTMRTPTMSRDETVIVI